MTKENLRKIYLQKRLALPLGDYQIFNKKISDHFFSHIDLRAVNLLHSFLPIEKTKEVDTWLIINRLRTEFPQVKIAVPRINTETATLDHFYFEDNEQLQKNTWGIPEPKFGIPTPIQKIDIILVPLLVADEQGHRVGYGRGFYDKFLNQCSETSFRIGVSFFPPVSRIDDVNKHDHPLTHLITPEEFITF